MTKLHHASRIAVVLAGVAALTCLADRQASAGLFNRRTVIVTSPTYVYPAPVTTVYSSPVVSAPVPASYTTTNTVVSTPVPAVYEAPSVVASPVVPSVVASPVVPTMYAAPVVVRSRVIAPRRVYLVP